MKPLVTLITILALTLGPYGCAYQSQVDSVKNQVNLIQHKVQLLEKENSKLKLSNKNLAEENLKQQKEINKAAGLNVIQNKLLFIIMQEVNIVVKELKEHLRKTQI